MANNSLLILFDGHALIHRGFHALPGLSTSEGQPVGAVYGFTSMLLKVLKDFHPYHCAVTFDSAAPTFRHIDYEAYKAHRPKAPDELISQFSLVRELVQCFSIPSFEVDGYEADDLLGTIGRQASSRGITTIIVTGDTDVLQLVSSNVKVLMPKARKPFSDTQLYDEEAVYQKYGLAPHQIADFKGLVGDSSDNIPGVPGVGQKTATRLLDEFSSIDNIYQQIDKVTPVKLQQKLRENEALARQSKALATIVTDAPINLDLEACEIGHYDREKVVAFFRRLEFYSLLDKIPPLSADTNDSAAIEDRLQTSYVIVDAPDKLADLIGQISGAELLSFDTETTSTNARQAQLVGISFSSAPGNGWYIPLGHTGSANQLSIDQVAATLKALMSDLGLLKVAHNAKYDITVMAKYGISVDPVTCDTMIAAHLLGEKALGLKPLAFNKLGIEMTPITDLIGSGKKQICMADVAAEKASDYACSDTDMTLRLCHHLRPLLEKDGLDKLFYEVEMPLIPVLHTMETNGVALDTNLLKSMSTDLASEIQRIESEIYAWTGHEFNLNSSQQLGKVLFDELKLPPARKTKSGFSTDAAVLEGLRGTHPVVGYLIDYRQLTKLKSTYVDTLPSLVDPATNRLHTSFNQTVTATGRLSSSDPNLQNIPIRTEIGRKIRRAFTVPDDKYFLLGADYSQVELRVLAYLSQDRKLIDAFLNDEDIHTATAAQVFGVDPKEVGSEMRRIAKVVNFGVIYGMSDYGLEQATTLTRKEASDFIDAYFEKYSGVKKYLENTRQQAIDQGFVQTVMGRRRYVPEITSSNYQVRQAAERMAINMPVQGTAAEIIKVAMIRIQNEIDRKGLSSKMILQVHDELLFEVPEEEGDELRLLVREIMPGAMDIGIPLKVDIKSGKNWGEAE